MHDVFDPRPLPGQAEHGGGEVGQQVYDNNHRHIHFHRQVSDKEDDQERAKVEKPYPENLAEFQLCLKDCPGIIPWQGDQREQRIPVTEYIITAGFESAGDNQCQRPADDGDGYQYKESDDPARTKV